MGMDIYGKNEPTYFRANLWGWRPIHNLSAMAIDKYNLKLSTDGWENNDGCGLQTDKECKELATAITKMITEYELFNDDDDIIYLCLGMWCTNSGEFVPDKEIEELNNKYTEGSIMKYPVVSSKGILVYPSHSTSLSRIKEWVAFLKECGGFQIF